MLSLLGTLAANSTVTTITVMTALVVGSGTGGILGAVIALKRFRLEQKTAVTQEKVGLRTVDVEQFRAMFPGGLGDAVEHWRNEAKSLYDEVDDLRQRRREDNRKIINLKIEVGDTQSELAETKLDLAKTKEVLDKCQLELEEAKARIKNLEP